MKSQRHHLKNEVMVGVQKLATKDPKRIYLFRKDAPLIKTFGGKRFVEKEMQINFVFNFKVTKPSILVATLKMGKWW